MIRRVYKMSSEVSCVSAERMTVKTSSCLFAQDSKLEVWPSRLQDHLCRIISAVSFEKWAILASENPTRSKQGRPRPVRFNDVFWVLGDFYFQNQTYKRSVTHLHIFIRIRTYFCLSLSSKSQFPWKCAHHLGCVPEANLLSSLLVNIWNTFCFHIKYSLPDAKMFLCCVFAQFCTFPDSAQQLKCIPTE